MNVHSGYAKPILKMAQHFGLIGSQYAWVVTDGTMNDAVSYWVVGLFSSNVFYYLVKEMGS